MVDLSDDTTRPPSSKSSPPTSTPRKGCLVLFSFPLFVVPCAGDDRIPLLRWSRSRRRSIKRLDFRTRCCARAVRCSSVLSYLGRPLFALVVLVLISVLQLVPDHIEAGVML